MSLVRIWHQPVGPLHQRLPPALEDELIARNPCLIKGASVEHSEERPVATIEQVAALVDTIQPRYKALVLMAAWTGLRWGSWAASASPWPPPPGPAPGSSWRGWVTPAPGPR